MEILSLLAVAATALGAATAVTGIAQRRRATIGPGEYLRDLQSGPVLVDEFQKRLAEPFRVRIVRALAGSVFGRIERVTPRTHLEGIRRKLALAGRDTGVRAEEF